MNTTSTSGLPLSLIFTGALITISALIARWATGTDEVGYLVATGGMALQLTGSVLRASQSRRQRR